MSLEHLAQGTQKERETQYMTVEIAAADKTARMTLPDPDNRPEIKLVALDLDGTTLREDKTFSPRLVSVIKRLSSLGVYTAICSGRAPESVNEFAQILGLNEGHGYCVCFNGGALIRLDDITRDLFENTLNAQDLIDIEAAAVASGCVVHAYSTRRVLLTESNIKFTEMEIAASMQPFEKLKFPEEINPQERCYKVIAVGEAERLDAMRSAVPASFKDRFNIARTHPNFLEFMVKGCSKGSTLHHLCAALNITRDNVVAFGDAENDIEMLQEAGIGVAVANAMPTLKAVARYQTYNYMDDGVAIYLEKLFDLQPE